MIYSARKMLSCFATEKKRSSANYCINAVKLWTKKKIKSTLKTNQGYLVNRAQGSRRKNSHRRFESRCNINSINCKDIDKGWTRGSDTMRTRRLIYRWTNSTYIREGNMKEKEDKSERDVSEKYVWILCTVICMWVE